MIYVFLFCFVWNIGNNFSFRRYNIHKCVGFWNILYHIIDKVQGEEGGEEARFKENSKFAIRYSNSIFILLDKQKQMLEKQ